MPENSELIVNHDKLISKLEQWKSEEASRASEAGETREDIGNFLELTGLNKKALSFVRMLDKQEEDKRADIQRSLNALLDTIQPHWDGQSTPDMFDDTVEPSDDDLEADTSDFEDAMDDTIVNFGGDDAA